MMRTMHSFSLALTVAAFAGVAGCSAQHHEAVNASPALAEGSSGTSLQSQGISQKACANAIAYSDAHDGLSVLVLYNGVSVCETYSGTGGPQVANELWSGTKSFSGVMAAIAAKDGLLKLDEKASDTITEWKADPLKSEITIRHLLSLTSGLVSETPGRPGSYEAALAAPINAAPGTTYAYGPVHYQAFGALMTRKLWANGQNPDPAVYLRTKLLEPLGINSSAWRRTQSGDVMLPQGMALTARDWAKFGEFVRSGGRIGGALIVDPTVFADQFKGSSVHPGYGLTWWLPRVSNQRDVTTMRNDFGRKADQFPSDTVVAGGAGDQRLYVIPSRGLTIVRQAAFDVRSALANRREAAATGADASSDRWSDATFITTLLAP